MGGLLGDGGAWYQGPDPLNVGASGEGGDITTEAATAYTRNVPEWFQVANAPLSFGARLVDENPGGTVREPEAGPTDAYGDRRGPVDDLFDLSIERDSSDAANGDFEDDSDLPGPSGGEWLSDPSDGTAQLLGEGLTFVQGDWEFTGDNGDPPDNPDGTQTGRTIMALIALLVVIYTVGQLFEVEV